MPVCSVRNHGDEGTQRALQHPQVGCVPGLGFRVESLGFGVQGLGFRVQGLGHGVEG